MKYEKQLKSNAEMAAEIMGDYLKGKKVKPEKVKLSSVAVTQYQRFMATKGVFAHLGFSIARSIAKDREELKGMVEQPKLP